MKIPIRSFLLPFIFLILASCNRPSNKSSNVDNFYTEKGEWDSARIPLIKPYEAVITNKDFGWGINLDGEDGDTGFFNIKRLTVINGVILVYSTNSIFHGIDVKQSWHIIVPGKHIEKGFANHQEYLSYLNTLEIKAEPALHDIELVAEYFENHDIVDWDAIK